MGVSGAELVRRSTVHARSEHSVGRGCTTHDGAGARAWPRHSPAPTRPWPSPLPALSAPVAPSAFFRLRLSAASGSAPSRRSRRALPVALSSPSRRFLSAFRPFPVLPSFPCYITVWALEDSNAQPQIPHFNVRSLTGAAVSECVGAGAVG